MAKDRNRPPSKKKRRIRNPDSAVEFDNSDYQSGKVYGLHLPLRRGYGVTAHDVNPANKQPNGRLINVRGEKIDFWIEEMETAFEMAGSTGQSHKLRQFFPHNMVQPSIKIRGRAPNSFQYNRLASFIRVGQHDALSTDELREAGIPLRNVSNKEGQTYIIPTLRFIIRNGSGNGKRKFPYNSRNVKGIHKAWKLEGYVKGMAAGAQRHDPAPAFEFEFMVAESEQTGQVGIWDDIAVAGDQIRPWIDIFESAGKSGFIRSDRITGGVPGEDRFPESDAANSVGGAIEDVGFDSNADPDMNPYN